MGYQHMSKEARRRSGKKGAETRKRNMAARKLRKQEEAKEIKVTRADETGPVTLLQRITWKPGEKLMELDKFAIQMDALSGLPVVAISKKYGLSRKVVSNALKEGVDLSSEAVSQELRKMTFRLLDTMHRTIDVISPSELEQSSMSQKANFLSVVSDKVLQVIKHLDGSKDPTGGFNLSFEHREDLESSVKKRLEAFGLQAVDAVVEEDTEDVRKLRVAEGVDEDEHTLIEYAGGEVHPKGKDVFVDDEETGQLSLFADPEERALKEYELRVEKYKRNQRPKPKSSGPFPRKFKKRPPVAPGFVSPSKVKAVLDRLDVAIDED